MVPSCGCPRLTDATSRDQVIGRSRQQQQQGAPVVGVGLRLNRQSADQSFMKQRGKLTNGGIGPERRTAIDGEEFAMHRKLHRAVDARGALPTPRAATVWSR